MAAKNGRNLKIKRGLVVIAGIRTKTVTLNGEPIDITSDDDAGYRTLLNEPGVKSLDISCEGVTKDDQLLAIIAGGGSLLLTNISIEFPSGATIEGDFFFPSLEETGAHNDAVTFSASFQSSGEFVYTPAA